MLTDMENIIQCWLMYNNIYLVLFKNVIRTINEMQWTSKEL